jgi:hypothetical protein
MNDDLELELGPEDDPEIDDTELEDAESGEEEDGADDVWTGFGVPDDDDDTPEPPAFDETSALGILASKGYTIVAPDGSYAGSDDEDLDPYDDLIQEKVDQRLAPIMASIRAQQVSVRAAEASASLAKKYNLSADAARGMQEDLSGRYANLLELAAEKSEAGMAARELLEGVALIHANKPAAKAFRNGKGVPPRTGGSPGTNSSVDNMDADTKAAIEIMKKRMGV